MAVDGGLSVSFGDLAAPLLGGCGPRETLLRLGRLLAPLGLDSIHYLAGLPCAPRAPSAPTFLRVGRSERDGFVRALIGGPDTAGAAPIRDYCQTAVSPFQWGGVTPDGPDCVAIPGVGLRHDLGPKGALERLAQEAGVGGGLLVPLHGPERECFGAMVYLLGHGPHGSPRPLPVGELTALAHSLHVLVSCAPGHTIGNSPLSRREGECLVWVAAGLRTKELAHRMGIAVETANEHILRACKKLRAKTRSECVARAVSLGLISI